MAKKERKKKLRNTLEKRPDRSETVLQLYLGASVSFELPLSSASLPPSTKLCGTEHHCQAATSLHHQNILHCLLASPAMQFNRLSLMAGYPRSRELIEAENPLHPCTLHPLALHCIHLQFTGTSRPTCYSTISTCSIFSVQHI